MPREPLSDSLRRQIAAEPDPARRRNLMLLLPEAERVDEAHREAELIGKVFPTVSELLEEWEQDRERDKEGKG